MPPTAALAPTRATTLATFLLLAVTAAYNMVSRLLVAFDVQPAG